MSFGTFTYENQAMLRLEHLADQVAHVQDQQHDQYQDPNNFDDENHHLENLFESQNEASLAALGTGVEGDMNSHISTTEDSTILNQHEPAQSLDQAADDSNINLAALMAMEAVKENLSFLQEEQQETSSTTTLRPLEATDRHNLSASSSSTVKDLAFASNGGGGADTNEVSSSTASTSFMPIEYQFFDVGQAGSAIIAAPSSNKEPEIIFKIVDGKFECPREGCGKLYKNKNGLKYHLTKGLCNGSFEVVGADGKLVDGTLPTPNQSKDTSPRHTNAPRLKKEDFANDPDAYARYKPFWCRKCSKRYKNINGLRYHAKVEHPEFVFDQIKGQLMS